MAMVNKFSSKTVLIILLFSIFTLACNDTLDRKDLPIFKSHKLQDTLNWYLSQVDSFPEYGNPTIIYITLYESDDCPMVDLDVEAGWLIRPIKDSSQKWFYCRGRFNGRLVFIDGNDKYKKYVYTKRLRLSPGDRQLLERQSKYMLKETIDKSTFHREYHFIPPDSLILVKSGLRW